MVAPEWKVRGKHRFGKEVHRCEVAAGSIIEDLQHGVGRNAGLARHCHCLRGSDEADCVEHIICKLHRLRRLRPSTVRRGLQLQAQRGANRRLAA